MKILFLHGLESKPGGTKAKFLEKAGHTVFNPFLPKHSLEESIAIAQRVVEKESPDIVVGSSRGGAIATTIDTKGARLILIAPAWKLYGVMPLIDSNTTVLHCLKDDTVPFEHTVELASKANITVELASKANITIIECGTCHRMSDELALKALLDAVQV